MDGEPETDHDPADAYGCALDPLQGRLYARTGHPLGAGGRWDPYIQAIGPMNIGRDAVLSPCGESAMCPTDIPASDLLFFKFKTGAK